MNDSLETRMKSYEFHQERTINPDQYFCVRLDGHSFSKYTKGFEKPFDKRFSEAMVMTSWDALKEFSAASAYTQSDEITLIFDKGDHLFNGRHQKILSLIASFVSAKFNRHFNYLLKTGLQYKSEVLHRINENSAWFDARLLVFSEENKGELLNHLIWRQRDCMRNAVSAYAQYFYTSEEMENVNNQDKIELIKKKLDWDNEPLWKKCGVFIKREAITFTNEKGPYTRNKRISVSFLLKYSEINLNFFLATHYSLPDCDYLESF